jgi:glycosyltransferase involved in cell wall biosynthesis
MKVLFLYTELAAYILNCCEKLSETAEVHIIRWPVNKEAPFEFNPSHKIHLYDRKQYSFDELRLLCASIGPDVIVCSGWIDKAYVRICRTFASRIPVVLTLDTHWKGTLKQQFASVIGRVMLHRIFTHAWVPGTIQEKYARRLGFRKERIKLGFYCCDLPFFNSVFEGTRPLKKQQLPKRFIYTGRYYDFKGVKELWQAFSELADENDHGWELWCIGTGSIEPFRHKAIRHFGFVQPQDLPDIMKDAGVFILPSRYEPWGVVVHEFAAAGFPLLLSDAVGAGEAFLQENVNGYLFTPGSVNSIKSAMKKIMELPANDLLLMGVKSYGLAQKITPSNWVATLTGIYTRWHEEKNTDHRGGR